MRMPTRSASYARSSTNTLNRVIPFGERHFRRTIAEFVAHYHGERNHQGLDNALIDGAPPVDGGQRIRRRQRLGGLLNYYYRAA
jgi:putative transposase